MMLMILGIGGTMFAFYILHSMKYDFLKKFEKSCYESIEKRDKELKEKEKFNKTLKKILFK